MPRSDWRIILAIVIGLGTVGTTYSYYEVEQATRPEYPKNNYQPARNASFPIRRVAGQPKAKEYDPHCQQPETSADGDLCAQWGAVEAVDESNRLVRINILLTLALGALGILATGIGAVLVYRSLTQSEEGLKAAREANEHARIVSDKELRPWISVKVEPSLFKMSADIIKISYDAICTNIGQTPAYNVEVSGTLKYLTDASYQTEIDSEHAHFRSEPRQSKQTIIPGDVAIFSSNSSTTMSSIPWTSDGIDTCVLCVIVIHVSYNTDFDKEIHRSELSFIVGKAGTNFMDRRYLYTNMRHQTAKTVRVSQFYSGEVS